MKKLLTLVLAVFTFSTAYDLKSIPCQYLMPGEVLESSATHAFRSCIINTSDSEKQISYLVHAMFIEYSNNQVNRWNWMVLPICYRSEILIIEQGTKYFFMVDTLSEGSWIKRLYRRTCD